MFFHHDLYDFWFRSRGVWVSKLVKVTVGLLDEQELLAISQIHQLSEAEFGVKMAWNYVTKDESGQMSWCVDANQPNLVFTNKSLTGDTPRILDYQMIGVNKLVIKFGKLEETFYLENDNKRLRELRQEGKLIRRLWEEKLSV
ncbi:hypothetical protein H6F98_23295 [Microcoleus sp. FACHB-SPT15]|nr:hypothetical protein [Microcoleus sp. FACHB-SPT15]